MDRRGILRGLMRVACATPPVFAVAATTAHAATPPSGAKVVYHLSDLDKVDFVLGNIHNHFKGVGGPEHVTIVLVVHGPALKAFHVAGAAPATSQRAIELHGMGLGLDACINTMHAQNVTLKDLVPGFGIAEKGGVVRLAELQAQGYIYLRP